MNFFIPRGSKRFVFAKSDVFMPDPDYGGSHKKRLVLMNSRYFILIIFFMLIAGYAEAQKYGCTDRLAVNYDPSVTINDGSCIYNPANAEPSSSFSLAGSLSETSGLIFWNNQLWTHNDNTDTNIYSLDTLSGNIVRAYPLSRISNFDVDGLITGAVYLMSEKIIALSGYSDKLEPFVYLLYDFKGSDFFGGNKRKIELLLPYHQTEGIATANGIKYYISNESFSLYPVIDVPQRLYIFDLTFFLGDYLNLPIPFPDAENNFIILPVPAYDFITVKSYSALLPIDYILVNLSGQIILKGRLTSENSTINLSGLAAGIYILRIGEERKHSYKVIKE